MTMMQILLAIDHHACKCGEMILSADHPLKEQVGWICECGQQWAVKRETLRKAVQSRKIPVPIVKLFRDPLTRVEMNKMFGAPDGLFRVLCVTDEQEVRL